jgi:hypothetical protein
MLIPLPNKLVAQGRAENAINGGDAEVFAMAKALLACRAEGQWGSREDDSAKIDLILTLDHPWHPGERMLVLCQVKSGPSYGEILRDGTGFKLLGAAKVAAKRSSHDICMIWVDRDLSRAFWAFLHPNSKSGVQEYGAIHEINPTMLFDLARCMAARSPTGSSGGRGVMLPDVTSDIPVRRALALQAYRKAKSVQSPILGDIELTRLGWRHMFRKSRAAANKNASLNLIPRLEAILKCHPSATAITASDLSDQEGYVRRTCEYLLKYERVNIRRKGDTSPRTVTVHVRVLEEICFPTDWERMAMLSQQVSRRVVLKSAYYKER